MLLRQTNIQVELEREQKCSLPVLIQLVQNISKWDSVNGVTSTSVITNKSYDPRRPGTIGNYNYAFTIEVPNISSSEMSPNFYNLWNTLSTDKSPKISKHELFNRFLVFKIPDYGNQTLSLGMLDFIPFCYYKGYKIGQDKIGMIRSFTTKEVYLLLDKADTENKSLFDYCGQMYQVDGKLNKSNLLTVYINYKRYYTTNNIASGSNNKLATTEYRLSEMAYNKLTNRYECKIKTKFNRLSEENIRNISVYIRENSTIGYYKVMNSNLYKSIYINGINLIDEIVSKQANRDDRTKTEKDFFKLVVQSLYGVLSDNLYGDFKGDGDIEFTVELNNFLGNDFYGKVYIGSSENLTVSSLISNPASVESFKFTEANQFDLYVRSGNNLYSRARPYLDFMPVFSNSVISSFNFFSNVTKYEIIPHYDDREYLELDYKFGSVRNLKLNIHKLLKENHIYKYNLDLKNIDIDIFINGTRVKNETPTYKEIKLNSAYISSFLSDNSVKNTHFYVKADTNYEEIDPYTLITDEYDGILYTYNNGKYSIATNSDLEAFKKYENENKLKLYYKSNNASYNVIQLNSVAELKEYVANKKNPTLYYYDNMSFEDFYRLDGSILGWKYVSSQNGTTYLNTTLKNVLSIQYNNGSNNLSDSYNNNLTIILKYDKDYADNSDLCANEKGNLIEETNTVYNNNLIEKEVLDNFNLGSQYKYTILEDPILNVFANSTEKYSNVQKEQEFYLYDGSNALVNNILEDNEPRAYSATVTYDKKSDPIQATIVSTNNAKNSTEIITVYHKGLQDAVSNIEKIYGDIDNAEATGDYVENMVNKYENLEISIKNIKDMLRLAYRHADSSYDIKYSADSSISDRFMALAINMETNDKFNLLIYVNGVLTKVEYNCYPEDFTYIHLPYYFQDETNNLKISFSAEGNNIKSYQIMY